MLIDSTFFVGGELNIPNPSGSTTNLLQWYINKYETDCLIKILGYPLYKAYLADPSLSTTPIANLVNGVEYTNDWGYDDYWVGLVESKSPGEDAPVVSQPTSMIANYIYTYYIRGSANQFAGTTTVIATASGAYNVSPSQKAQSAHTFFCVRVREMVKFLLSQSQVANYTEFSNYQAAKTLSYARPVNSFDI